nr:MAG TPA: hypothetical protein [Caudoviricetes sp.]
MHALKIALFALLVIVVKFYLYHWVFEYIRLFLILNYGKILLR